MCLLDDVARHVHESDRMNYKYRMKKVLRKDCLQRFVTEFNEAYGASFGAVDSLTASASSDNNAEGGNNVNHNKKHSFVHRVQSLQLRTPRHSKHGSITTKHSSEELLRPQHKETALNGELRAVVRFT